MARTRLAMRSIQLARVVGVAALALGVPVVGPVSPASAAGCSESTKFVQELATNPVTGDNDYFGIRGSAYTFNHLPMCSGTGVAQSFFVRLGPDYSSWVEMGASQYSNDTANHTHAWAKWRYLPSQSALKTYDTAAGILGTGLTYSFMLQNGTGTTWNIYFAHSGSPDGIAWNYVDSTGSMGAFRGPVESELSRYGTAHAQDHPTHLEEQRSYNGSYYGWQHLGCDYAQWSILDYTAVRVSQSEWYMSPRPPGSGEC